MNSRRKFIKHTGIGLAGSIISSAYKFADGDKSTIELIKPKALKKGDTIAVSAPASAVWDEAGVEKFIIILQNIGFNVVPGSSLKNKFGYFAGTAVERAEELNRFFADPGINGILSMKGGWGSAQLLDKLDYTVIKSNPKVFMGFSDITALLINIHKQTGLITFHGPVGNSTWNNFTINSFNDCLIAANKIEYQSNSNIFYTLYKGKAKGKCIAGNLSVLVSLIGTPFEPLWEQSILFIEEVKEEPYVIDRMLTQLKQSGAYKKLNGLVWGICSKCIAEEPEKSFTLKEVLSKFAEEIKIPSFYGAAFGHIEDKLTLPIGISVSINADVGSINFNESAVTK